MDAATLQSKRRKSPMRVVALEEQPGTLAQTTISHSSRRHAMSPEKPRRYWLSNQGLSS